MTKENLRRKIGHLIIILVLLLAYVAVPRILNITLATIMSYILLIATEKRSFRRYIGIRRNRSFAVWFFPLAFEMAVQIFWNIPLAYVFIALVAGLGDTIAYLVGRSWQINFWSIFEKSKTIAGAVAMWIVIVLGGLSMLWFMEPALLSFGMAFKLIIIGGALAYVEFVMEKGLDNVFLPFAAGLLWFLTMNV